MLTLDEKKINREKEDDKDGLSSKVDVTILGLLSGKKGVKEKNEVKVEVKKTKGKQKKVTCWAGKQRKRLKKQWLNQDKEGKIEKRMRSDERKEGKKEEDETKGEYDGGMNQNVRITARCLNFEKDSIWG